MDSNNKDIESDERVSAPEKTPSRKNICDDILGCLACVTVFIGGCLLVGLVLGFIAAIVCLYVYSIMALVEYSNNDIQDKCDESNMWIYLLVSVIISGIQGSNGNNTNEDTFGLHLFGLLPMLIWGCVEFWDRSCIDEIDGTSVYYMANIWFTMYWIGSSIIGLCLLLASCGALGYITAFAIAIGDRVRGKK